MKKIGTTIGALFFSALLSLQVQAGPLTNHSEGLLSGVTDSSLSLASAAIAGVAQDFLQSTQSGRTTVNGTYGLFDWLKSLIKRKKDYHHNYKQKKKVPEMDAAGAGLALAFLASILALFREKRS
ncbi:MAG: hypothetical protein AAGA91_05885 [Pseudomonadota bacterium]